MKKHMSKKARRRERKSVEVDRKAITLKKPQNNKSNKRKGWLPGLSGTLGSAVGSYFGGPVGGAVGGQLGNWFGRITGLGTYKVRKNTLLTDNGPPMFSSGKTHSTVVHREFLGDIKSSTGFAIQEFPINPGSATTFPWLAGVANSFEQYRLRGLVFEFRTTCGTAVGSTNTALGTVVMSTNYDVLDPAFSDKKSMEAYTYTVSTVPSGDALHPVECAPDQTTVDLKYTRDDNYEYLDPDNSDLRFHDWGNFYIATVGMQEADVTLGELWVSYHVELYKPKIDANAAESNTYTIDSPILTEEFGSSQVGYTTNNINGIEFLPVGAEGVSTVQLPEGVWLCTYAATSLTTGIEMSNPNLLQDCEFAEAIPYGYFISGNGALPYAICIFAVYSTGPAPQVEMRWGSGPTVDEGQFATFTVTRIQDTFKPEPTVSATKVFDPFTRETRVVEKKHGPKHYRIASSAELSESKERQVPTEQRKETTPQPQMPSKAPWERSARLKTALGRCPTV